jgi:hypothetical protein
MIALFTHETIVAHWQLALIVFLASLAAGFTLLLIRKTGKIGKVIGILLARIIHEAA